MYIKIILNISTEIEYVDRNRRSLNFTVCLAIIIRYADRYIDSLCYSNQRMLIEIASTLRHNNMSYSRFELSYDSYVAT